MRAHEPAGRLEQLLLRLVGVVHVRQTGHRRFARRDSSDRVGRPIRVRVGVMGATRMRRQRFRHRVERVQALHDDGVVGFRGHHARDRPERLIRQQVAEHRRVRLAERACVPGDASGQAAPDVGGAAGVLVGTEPQYGADPAGRQLPGHDRTDEDALADRGGGQK